MSSGATFPLSLGVDPSVVMELLASLPEEEQARVLGDAVRGVDELEQQAQPARSQEGLVRRFKDMRATFVRPGGFFADQLAKGELPPSFRQVQFTAPDAKPVSSVRSLRSLKPMVAAELEVGTTHRGRYLCGRVAVDDAFFGVASATLLVEDVTGRLVEVAIYNLVDTDLPARERQHRVASQFPKGKPIVILEPYYKVRQDMTEGIRVDKPCELAEWQDVPKDLLTWKQLGNDYFDVLNVRNQGRGSLACYHRALRTAKVEIQPLAVLLNNLATCRLKAGDFTAAIQLAGAAAHLDPEFLKAWLRLASSLVEAGRQEAGNHRGWLIAMRVVAHASSSLTDLTAQQQQMLERTLTGEEKPEPESEDHDNFQSYAGWCAALDLSTLVLASPAAKQMYRSSASTSDVDTWRKEGSSHFSKNDYQAAEKCYLHGVAASAACCRNVSIVLNNIANVHLMLHRETSAIPGISANAVKGSVLASESHVPSMDLALLNCTVAGIIDPLNTKAWVRRSRCLHKLGYTPEECIRDLKAVYACIVEDSGSPADADKREQESKRLLNAEMHRLAGQSDSAKKTSQVSEVSTEAQREQRDAGRPENLTSSARRETSANVAGVLGDEASETIDEYIARMESFNNMTQFAFAAAKSKPHHLQKQLPREIVMKATNPPPQVHLKFPKLRGWPDGIDPTFARKVLYRAFLNAESQPWSLALTMRQGAYYQSLSPADMIKRWHGTGALEILHAKGGNLCYGDIIDGREAMSDVVPAYDSRIRSNFANNPNRSEVYFFGTTHVAIGFNDFSSLLSASMRDKSPGTVGPLRFVGFEMSEFSVAKCRVVAHMLGSPNVAVTSVMEVWLSSTWSEGTLRDFRKSVNMVLVSLHGHDENAKVLSYLHYWASAETISAPKARCEFFENLERYNSKSLMAVYCFRREIDQLELTQYMLTGELRASPGALDTAFKSNTTTAANAAGTEANATKKKKRNRKKKASQHASTSLVGSLTMWNVPAGAPPLEEDIAFNTVDFMTIVEDYAKLQKSQVGAATKLTVVDLFVVHILQNLQRLRSLMIEEKLTIDVSYSVVKAVRGETVEDSDNQELLTRIASMRPYTISWSNVLDYFLPDDFHDLARRCSVHGDCMHYGYSMNWTTQVLGASIMDYDFESDEKMINATLDSALGFPSESGMAGMSSVFKMSGLDKLLLLPFRDNPLNMTAYVLAQAFKDKWVEHFMVKGRLTAEAKRRLSTQCSTVNCGIQRGAISLGMPSPLYRTSLTLYMSWTYDPEIRLQAAQNPLEVGPAVDMGTMADFFSRLSADEQMRLWEDMQAEMFM